MSEQVQVGATTSAETSVASVSDVADNAGVEAGNAGSADTESGRQELFPMPELWHERNQMLRDALIGSGFLDGRRLLSDMIPGWDDILVSIAKDMIADAASGILPGAGGFLITTLLNKWYSAPSVVQLHQDALHAIESIVHDAIEQSVIMQYTGMVNAARSKLLVFAETRDVNLLDNNLFSLFDTIGVLQNIGVKAVAAYGMAVNLHLVAILAKAEHAAAYMASFNRLRIEYAAHMVNMANILRDGIVQRANRLPVCGCFEHEIPSPSAPSQRVVRYECRRNLSLISAAPLHGVFDHPEKNEEIKKQVREQCERKRQEEVDAQISREMEQSVTPITQAAQTLGTRF